MVLLMQIDCHMHTPLCGHAHGWPVDFVLAAAERGIELITFTCHIPLDAERFGGPHIRMDASMLPRYFELTGHATELGRLHGVRVLTGIEAEVYPEPEALAPMDRTLEAYPFDFVLGSLHHQCPGYQQRVAHLKSASDYDIVEMYFRDLAEGARSGRYDSMSHPDVIRIYGTVSQFDPEDHEPAIRAFLQALLDTHTCMEVNTSGLIKGVYQVHPDPVILDWARDMGVRLTLGSDAHIPEQVGQHFDTVRAMLARKGFSTLHYFEKRNRVEVPLEIAS